MIRSSRTDAVVTIELDRAEKRNALNEEMLSGLSDAFSAAVDGDARAIVLTGRGPVFSAGADLTGPVYDLGFLDGVMTLMEKIESVPVPVIAAVSGAPSAPGCNWRWPPICGCSHRHPGGHSGRQTRCVR